MTEYSFTVNENETGMTVESLIRSRMHIAGSRLRSLKFNHGLFLNGTNVHSNVKVTESDKIRVVFPDEKSKIKPFDLPLTVAFEDEHLMVIDKPAPLPTVSSCHKDENTLENAVYSYLGCPEEFTYRPVNRLDRGTSGLLVAAKNPHCQYLLQQQLHTPGFVRKYLAVTDGRPTENEGIISVPIASVPGSNKRVVSPEGKMCVTRYRVLMTGNAEGSDRKITPEPGLYPGIRSLIELQLETGRTHQIRVHMAYLSCPVTGDYLYGTPCTELPERFALHSYYLSFTHPVMGEKIEIKSDLPDELQRLIGK